MKLQNNKTQQTTVSVDVQAICCLEMELRKPELSIAQFHLYRVRKTTGINWEKYSKVWNVFRSIYHA